MISKSSHRALSICQARLQLPRRLRTWYKIQLRRKTSAFFQYPPLVLVVFALESVSRTLIICSAAASTACLYRFWFSLPELLCYHSCSAAKVILGNHFSCWQFSHHRSISASSILVSFSFLKLSTKHILSLGISGTLLWTGMKGILNTFKARSSTCIHETSQKYSGDKTAKMPQHDFKESFAREVSFEQNQNPGIPILLKEPYCMGFLWNICSLWQHRGNCDPPCSSFWRFSLVVLRMVT